jgi:hypothetical protein
MALPVPDTSWEINSTKELFAGPGNFLFRPPRLTRHESDQVARRADGEHIKFAGGQVAECQLRRRARSATPHLTVFRQRPNLTGDGQALERRMD